MVAWLLLMPGTILLDYLFDVSRMELIAPVIAFIVFSAFGLLLSTVFAGFAYDDQRQIDLHSTSSSSG